MSIVFDRAVRFYDQTRAIPIQVQDAALDALVRETHLTRESPVLEIGIGTGRIAIPLARKIGRVSGVDLSLLMMNVLQQKAARDNFRIELAQADVVRLPFRQAHFDLIYAVHVLHLVKGWRDAVAEAHRLLKVGGYFVVSWHGRMPDSPNTLMRKELHRIAREHSIETTRPGAQSEGEIFDELRNWGIEPRVVNVAEWTEATTPALIIEELDQQLFSETWAIPREVMDETIPRVRAWALEQFGSLDREIVSPYNFRWLIAQKS